MKIAIARDHGAYEYKEMIKAMLARQRDLRLTSDADHLCAQQVQTVSQRAAQVAHADDDHRRPADHAHASGPLPYVPLPFH